MLRQLRGIGARWNVQLVGGPSFVRDREVRVAAAQASVASMNRVITNILFITETSIKVSRCCAFEIGAGAESYMLDNVASSRKLTKKFKSLESAKTNRVKATDWGWQAALANVSWQSPGGQRRDGLFYHADRYF